MEVEKELNDGQILQTKLFTPILEYYDSYKKKKVRKPFRINLKKTNDSLVKRNQYDINSLHFDFAKDYYVANISMSYIKNSTIHIEDSSGKEISEKYSLSKKDVFDLHKNFGHNWFEFKKGNTPKPWNNFISLLTFTIIE